jgi:cytochrome c556
MNRECVMGQARRSVWAVAALSMLGVVTIGAAQTGGTRVAKAPGTNPAEVIKTRQEGFKKVADAFKVIHHEVSGPSPDAAKIAAAAAQIKATTEVIESWFPPGSGPQSGVKTHAKAEIWTDASGFAATRAAYIRQVEKSVRTLADPGERAAWTKSSAALGQACKDCHDSYRVKG